MGELRISCSAKRHDTQRNKSNMKSTSSTRKRTYNQIRYYSIPVPKKTEIEIFFLGAITKCGYTEQNKNTEGIGKRKGFNKYI